MKNSDPTPASPALSRPTHAGRLVCLALAIRLAVGHQTLDLGAQVRILDRQPKTLRPSAGKHTAPSSSGPGHRPLKAEIAGSNPAGATSKTTSASHTAGRFFLPRRSSLQRSSSTSLRTCSLGRSQSLRKETLAKLPLPAGEGWGEGESPIGSRPLKPRFPRNSQHPVIPVKTGISNARNTWAA